MVNGDPDTTILGLRTVNGALDTTILGLRTTILGLRTMNGALDTTILGLRTMNGDLDTMILGLRTVNSAATSHIFRASARTPARQIDHVRSLPASSPRCCVHGRGNDCLPASLPTS